MISDMINDTVSYDYKNTHLKANNEKKESLYYFALKIKELSSM